MLPKKMHIREGYGKNKGQLFMRSLLYFCQSTRQGSENPDSNLIDCARWFCYIKNSNKL